jgi:predicted transglutaminase-like cysteine proteinase
LHVSPRAWTLLIWAIAFIFIAPGLAERLDLSDKVLAFIEKKYGLPARKRVTDWKRLMESNRNKSETEKLELVNQFFNQTPFVSDAEHWGKEDYWATPIEMLATSGGDCEDFAIGKYFTLVQLGVPVKKLQITYVKAMNWNPINQAHMVLAFYPTPEAIPEILDNLIPEIKSASLRKDLTPVYSFNGEGLWLAKERGMGKNVGGSNRIKLWTDLSNRIGKETDGQ